MRSAHEMKMESLKEVYKSKLTIIENLKEYDEFLKKILEADQADCYDRLTNAIAERDKYLVNTDDWQNAEKKVIELGTEHKYISTLLKKLDSKFNVTPQNSTSLSQSPDRTTQQNKEPGLREQLLKSKIPPSPTSQTTTPGAPPNTSQWKEARSASISTMSSDGAKKSLEKTTLEKPAPILSPAPPPTAKDSRSGSAPAGWVNAKRSVQQGQNVVPSVSPNLDRAPSRTSVTSNLPHQTKLEGKSVTPQNANLDAPLRSFPKELYEADKSKIDSLFQDSVQEVLNNDNVVHDKTDRFIRNIIALTSRYFLYIRESDITTVSRHNKVDSSDYPYTHVINQLNNLIKQAMANVTPDPNDKRDSNDESVKNERKIMAEKKKKLLEMCIYICEKLYETSNYHLLKGIVIETDIMLNSKYSVDIKKKIPKERIETFEEIFKLFDVAHRDTLGHLLPMAQETNLHDKKQVVPDIGGIKSVMITAKQFLEEAASLTKALTSIKRIQEMQSIGASSADINQAKLELMELLAPAKLIMDIKVKPSNLDQIVIEGGNIKITESTGAVREYSISALEKKLKEIQDTKLKDMNDSIMLFNAFQHNLAQQMNIDLTSFKIEFNQKEMQVEQDNKERVRKSNPQLQQDVDPIKLQNDKKVDKLNEEHQSLIGMRKLKYREPIDSIISRYENLIKYQEKMIKISIQQKAKESDIIALRKQLINLTIESLNLIDNTVKGIDPHDLVAIKKCCNMQVKMLSKTIEQVNELIASKAGKEWQAELSRLEEQRSYYSNLLTKIENLPLQIQSGKEYIQSMENQLSRISKESENYQGKIDSIIMIEAQTLSIFGKQLLKDWQSSKSNMHSQIISCSLLGLFERMKSFSEQFPTLSARKDLETIKNDYEMTNSLIHLIAKYIDIKEERRHLPDLDGQITAIELIRYSELTASLKAKVADLIKLNDATMKNLGDKFPGHLLPLYLELKEMDKELNPRKVLSLSPQTLSSVEKQIPPSTKSSH